MFSASLETPALEAERDVVRDDVAADRHGPRVIDAATPIHGDVGGAAADVEQHDPRVPLFREQYRFTGRERFEDDGDRLDTGAVRTHFQHRWRRTTIPQSPSAYRPPSVRPTSRPDR